MGRRDLLQEMHAALWRSLETFDGRCSLKTWTWRVAHNVGASHLGRHRARFVELDDLPGEDDVEARLDRSRALQRLTQLVHALQAVTITSSGSVHYAGSPRVTTYLTSSGKVEPIAQ